MTVAIFSHQRCGSSNLARFVRDATGVAVELEPFNRAALKRVGADWSSYRRIERFISSYCQKLDLVKHIYGQHSPDIDATIAQAAEIRKVLVLSRRNTDEAAFSAIVASKIGEYRARPDKDLGAIAPRNLRVKSKEMKEKSALIAEICGRIEKPVLSLAYEDIFGDDLDARKTKAREVLNFLFPNSDAPHFDAAFDKFLALDKKINSRATAELVSNIKELKEEFPSLQSL